MPNSSLAVNVSGPVPVILQLKAFEEPVLVDGVNPVQLLASRTTPGFRVVTPTEKVAVLP